jgi:hypothetical protein
MPKRSTLDIEDDVLRQHFDNINSDFMENVIALSVVPTASEPLLLDNQAGIYSNTLYKRKGSTIYVFNSDSQITIT